MLATSAHPAPDPHRTPCTWHGTCWQCPFTPGTGSVTLLALCHPGLALLLRGDSLPELDQSLSRVSSPILGS